MSMCADQSKNSLIILDTKGANKSISDNLQRSGYSIEIMDLNQLESKETMNPLEIIDQKHQKRQSELLGIPEIVLVAFNDAMKSEEKAPTKDNFVTWIMNLYAEKGGC